MAEKQKTDSQDAPGVTVSTSKDFGINAAKTNSDRAGLQSESVLAAASGAVGLHLIADFWGARYLTDVVRLEKVICAAVEASKATLLHIHLHRFDEGGGVTGVALLAESHISIHTWPELDYAAFDIFMCGYCDPLAALQVLRQQLEPEREDIQTIARGGCRK